MKTLLGAVSALALIAGTAMAAEQKVTGTIESLDEEQMTIMLDTGQSFELTEDLWLEGLAVGDEVTVSYEEENGELRAMEVAEVTEDEPFEEEPAEVIEEEEPEEETAG